MSRSVLVSPAKRGRVVAMYRLSPSGDWIGRLYAEVEDEVEVEPVGEFTLKGFQRPVAAFNVLAVREPATNDPSFRSISTNGEAAEPARKVRATD
jgi:hypothetical protein